MTVVSKNVSHVMDDLEATRHDADRLAATLIALGTNVSYVSLAAQSTEAKLEVMASNMTTIKVNLVGLGDYINNVNGDLGQMLYSFDGYSKQVHMYAHVCSLFELQGSKRILADT
jgi:hypothetical protein